MGVPVPVLVTAPVGLAVSVERVKDHLRIDGDHSDGDLADLVVAATGSVEDYVRRQLLTATYSIRFDCFPCGAIVLPRPPLVSVSEVTYRDSSDDVVTLDPSAYRVRVDRYKGEIEAVDSWPNGEDVTVTYVCGYGEADEVPAQLRHAIKLLAGELYLRREVTSEKGAVELPFGLRWLCDPHKVRGF